MTHRYTAAGGIVVDGDRILVLRDHKRGGTRLPKGHVEDGETLVEAALREVAEESGYVCEVGESLGDQLVTFTDDRRGDVERTEYFWIMRPTLKTSGEDRYEPEWLTHDHAIQQLSYEAEREWVRRARALRP